MSKPKSNASGGTDLEWSIDASEFQKAADELTHVMPEEAAPIIALSVRDMAVIVRRRVRQRLSRHRRTGRLQSYVSQSVYGAGFDFKAVVHSGGSVAHLIVGGVRPHEIRSTRPMPIQKSGGVLGFAQAVSHPGFRADHYFHDGVQDASPDVQHILDKAAQDMLDALKARVTK